MPVKDPALKREIRNRSGRKQPKPTEARALVLAEKLVSLDKQSNKPLTAQMQRFVDGILQGMAPMAAGKYAGIPAHVQSTVSRYTKNLSIQRAIEKGRADFEKANAMTKKRVMDGFLESIDVARLQADSVAMTGGWREIAKMCGYYEPTRHKLEVSVNGQVVIQKLQQLTDEQLLQLADGEADALDGEFQVIT